MGIGRRSRPVKVKRILRAVTNDRRADMCSHLSIDMKVITSTVKAVKIRAFPNTATGDIRAIMAEIEKCISLKAEVCSLATPSKLQRPRREYGGVAVELFDMVIC
ncbi:hypothetical protein ACROYT_G035868 [Oculina patagonica]